LKYFLIFSIVFLFSTLLTAQFSATVSYEGPRELRNVKIIKAQKEKGGLYHLLTDRGLFSFDGRRWEQFQRKAPLSNTATSIIPYLDKYLVGFEDGTLSLFNGRAYTPFPQTTDSINTPIRQLQFDSQGYLFVGTYGQGVFRLDSMGQWLSINSEQGLYSDDIYDLFVWKKNQLAIATDRGIQIINKNLFDSTATSRKNISFLKNHIITQCIGDSENDLLWAADYDGTLYRIDWKDKSTTKIFESPSAISSLSQRSGNRIFFSNRTHLFFFNDSTNKQTQISLKNPPENILSSVIDEQDRIWLQSQSSLLTVVHPRISVYSTPITSIQCISIAEPLAYLGTDNGIVIYDLKTQKILDRILPGINFLHLKWQPQRNQLWCASFGNGLYVFSPQEDKIYNISQTEGLINNSVLSINVMDSIILASTLGGLSVIHQTTLDILSNHFPNIPQSQYIYDAEIDNSGALWLGKDGRGAIVIDSLGRQNTYLNGKSIYKIQKVKNHIYLCTADDGINIFHSKASSWDTLYPNTLCISILADSLGYLYFFMDNEIVIHDPVRGQQAPLESQFIPANQNFFIHANDRDSEGNLWWPNDSILYNYIPQQEHQLQPHLRIQQIFLGKVQIDNEKYSSVSHTNNTLNIEYTGLWNSDPSAVRYRYKIKNYDTDWIVTRDQSIIYPKLPPGEYSFILQADINNDFSSPTEYQHHFTITPPFWKRPVFIIAISIIAIILIYAIVKNIISRNRKIDQWQSAHIRSELELIKNQINPHFLFNNFNTLINIVEENPEEAPEYIEHLSDFYRNMLLYRKQQVIALEQELKIVERYIFLLKKRFEEGLNFSLPEHYPPNSMIVPLSLQILIENAIKHNVISADSPLHIHIEIGDNQIVVKNNLQKKTVKPASTRFGLESLQKQYESQTKKTVRWQEKQDQFIVTLPLIKKEKA